MHKATKAALISAFIFPGGGHFFLKSKLRGGVFAVFSVACLWALMSFLMDIANDISEKLVNREIPFDVSTVMAEISSQLSGSAGEMPHYTSLLLLGCWVLSIIDSFVLGRKIPESTHPAKPSAV
ncbi:MAG: hypothetical protein ABJK37_16385 [Paraglaciecola sp.]|uniref:hypothetical protein n=1 Tax=Paraglaciecola sp. TaxID=1920173 RepID=UPI00329928B6